MSSETFGSQMFMTDMTTVDAVCQDTNHAEADDPGRPVSKCWDDESAATTAFTWSVATVRLVRSRLALF
jgi:hypothetical protein